MAGPGLLQVSGPVRRPVAPRAGELLDVAAVGDVQGEDLGAAGARRGEGEAAPGGREARRLVRTAARGQPARGERDEVDEGNVEAVALAARGVGEARAVGAPARAVVVFAREG